MIIHDLIERLGYKAVSKYDEETLIVDGYTSDLLSDVMGNAPEDSVLMTIQAHKNTVAVATLAGINTIILCNSRVAPEDMIQAAENEDIAVLMTPDSQFIASWKVHKLLEN